VERAFPPQTQTERRPEKDGDRRQLPECEKLESEYPKLTWSQALDYRLVSEVGNSGPGQQVTGIGLRRLVLTLARELREQGIAMAARMPMIATTIINSISEKPSCRFFMLFKAFR
jgi:hypothetical protein